MTASDKNKNNFDNYLSENTKLVLNPKTVETLISQGKITERFITYNEHLDKLFSDLRTNADVLIEYLPRLDKSIANATITALFEDLEKAFVLGLHGTAIDLGAKLLELACKFRLWEEKIKINSNAGWNAIEGMYFSQTIYELHKLSIINNDEYLELKRINKEVRNAYTHYKIQELIKRNKMVLKELPTMDAATGKVEVKVNVDPVEHQFMWFAAKRVLDKDTFVTRVQECMYWVNKILSGG